MSNIKQSSVSLSYPLVEAHDEHEVQMAHCGARIIGVNNRNLKDFTVDVQKLACACAISFKTMWFLYLKGSRNPEDIQVLRDNNIGM